MVLDTGQLQEAKLAEIRGSNLPKGVAGLEARTKRVREARRTFWAMIIFGILMPPLSIAAKYPAPPPLDFILAWEGAVAAMLLMGVWIGLGATPFFAKDIFYGDRIPPRAMWDPTELGQFSASDVTGVRVRSSNVGGLAWLDVHVFSRTGREARFSGFTRAAMLAEADRKGALLNPEAKADLMSHGGGAEDIVKWARAHDVPITTGAEPAPGAPPPN